MRSNETGQSRGFAFLGYEKQESTILAVDNFQGIKLAGRVIKVDHVDNYRSKEDIETEKKKSRKEHLNYAEIITKDVLKNKDSTINASSELLNRFNVLKKEKSMIENYRDDSSKRRVIRDIMSGGDDDSMSRRDDRVEKFVDGMDHSRSRKTLGTRQNFKDGNDQSYYFEERPNKRK